MSGTAKSSKSTGEQLIAPIGPKIETPDFRQPLPSDSGSEAVVKMLSPSPSAETLPILAAMWHGSLHTPTDGDGDEAAKSA